MTIIVPDAGSLPEQPAAAVITTSIFDLFKVGPGPSSSHTIGPMKAAYDFVLRLESLGDGLLTRATSIDVLLYGSLAATGKGHGTDRAVVAGLLRQLPETCDPQQFSELLQEETAVYQISVRQYGFSIRAADIHFERGHRDFPYSNTMQFRLMSNAETLHEEEYYSVGGGFILRKAETESAEQPRPAYAYSSMKELKVLMQSDALSLPALILKNEIALTGLSRSEIETKLDRIITFMFGAVKRGLDAAGVLPGTVGLERKAAELYAKAKEKTHAPESFFIYLNAYCLAASEENAAGHVVVTAPTSGASGVIPGLLFLLREYFHFNDAKLREGLMVAASIGFLVKHNASISGAEMGCMGEIGTAAAMGAALLSHVFGQSIEVTEAAAEIAIEHHLGMTCDPVGGYVQIPCIERNAMGAVKAYNAYLIASSGRHEHQKISLDRVIKVMRATGRDMSKKYKETSEAGLALSATEC